MNKQLVNDIGKIGYQVDDIAMMIGRIDGSLRDQKSYMALAKECQALKCSLAQAETSVRMYESFIDKLFKDTQDKSDKTFMLNGEIYALVEYRLDVSEDSVKTLSVEFRGTSPLFTKDFN